MRYTFLSAWSALRFALLIAVIFCSPIIVMTWNQIPRECFYRSIPTSAGQYHYLADEIFQRKDPIDILFLGPSLMWIDVDTSYVKDRLSQNLDREASVLTFGYDWEGLDQQYLILRDLLSHRKVNMLVINMPLPDREPEEPHPEAFRLFQVGVNSDSWSGLPMQAQLNLYAGSVLNLPRHLLDSIRFEPRRIYWPDQYLGHIPHRLGFESEPFVEFHPKPPELSDSLDEPMEIREQPLGPYQSHFSKLLFDLVKKNKIHLVILNLPAFIDHDKPAFQERMDWQKFFGVETPIVGVAPKHLFGKMSLYEIKKLYSDVHLNHNGSEYFTHAVTPKLLKLYSESANEL